MEEFIAVLHPGAVAIWKGMDGTGITIPQNSHTGVLVFL